MKSLLGLFLLLTVFSTNAATLSQLTGTYEISNPALPVVNVVTLGADGSVKLVETSRLGEFVCNGEATLTDDILETVVTCENGNSFTQKIDLEGVTNFETFTALVYSSLYDIELPMNFIKL
jgi:hypothetical protein